MKAFDGATSGLGARRESRRGLAVDKQPVTPSSGRDYPVKPIPTQRETIWGSMPCLSMSYLLLCG
jgi:hypothetical protein